MRKVSYSKKLYRKDSKGKIRSLEIKTDGYKLIQISGLLDGKKVTHEKVCVPKNVGKANETTPEEQALSQAESLYTKKIREGYFDTAEEAENNKVLKPMLAKSYDDHSKKIGDDEVVIAQPKLDGIRCVVRYDAAEDTFTATTRELVPITTIPHILEDLRLYYEMNNLAEEYEDYIWDGELYVHGLTFQEVTKLVKNDYDPKNPVQYHIYDTINTTKTCKERLDELLGYITCGSLVHVPYVLLQKDGLDEYYRTQFGNGYEGIMVRVLNALYKVNGRSADLLKYKKFYDIALPIVDITPSDARPDHGTVWVEYKGAHQKTGSKLSFDGRADLLTNKAAYIGKTAEIRYFEETDTGKLRFAYFHGLRFDK